MLEESVTSIPSIWASMNSWFTPTVLFLFLNLMIGTIYLTSNLSFSSSSLKPTAPTTQHHLQIARSPSVLQRLKSINFYSYRSPEPTTLALDKSQHLDTTTHFTFQQSPLQEFHQNQPFLSRSPSMLQRIKSINLYNYFSQEFPKNQDTLTTHFTPHQENISDEAQQVEIDQQEQEPEEDQDQEQTLDEIYSKLKSSNDIKMGRSKSDTKPTSGEVPKKLPKKMKKSASSKSAFAHFEEEDIVEARRPATVRECKDNNHKLTEVDDAEVDARADDFINRFKHQLKLQRIDSIIRYKEMINSASNDN